MHTYRGTAAKKYTQTKSKRYLVNPAIFRLLPKVKRKSRLLDIACGNADLFPEIIKRGYTYCGIDNSKDLLNRAMVDHPSGVFLNLDARTFSKRLKDKFDVIIINMLFPALPKKEEITKVLQQAYTVLSDAGRIIIATNNPAYDPYMTHGLLNGKNVQTKFSNYFDSPKRFDVIVPLDSGDLKFTDYHYTLSDYISSLHKAQLHLRYIDECSTPLSLKSKDFDFYSRKHLFSSFLIMECIKK